MDTSRKEFQQFFIADDNQPFTKKCVHRVRRAELFKAPMALMRRGLTPTLQCVSAFSNRDMVFTDSVFSIKSPKNDVDMLKSVVGILNSNLGNYLALNLTASGGVERHEIKEHEFLSFPMCSNKELANEVDLLQKKASTSILKDKELSKLNTTVSKVFELNDTERDVISYALEVSIPLWRFGDNRVLQPKALLSASENQLTDYAKVFCENFANDYKYFNVDIYPFKRCTLINFKAREKKPETPVIKFCADTKLESVMKKITPASVQSITNEIFMKKDIKGFGENSFFVLKTNEYKNWHRAVARLDVNEFINAIWEAEIEVSK